MELLGVSHAMEPRAAPAAWLVRPPAQPWARLMGHRLQDEIRTRPCDQPPRQARPERSEHAVVVRHPLRQSAALLSATRLGPQPHLAEGITRQQQAEDLRSPSHHFPLCNPLKPIRGGQQAHPAGRQSAPAAQIRGELGRRGQREAQILSRTHSLRQELQGLGGLQSQRGNYPATQKS